MQTAIPTAAALNPNDSLYNEFSSISDIESQLDALAPAKQRRRRRPRRLSVLRDGPSFAIGLGAIFGGCGSQAGLDSTTRDVFHGVYGGKKWQYISSGHGAGR
jgi:hypothetical protein